MTLVTAVPKPTRDPELEAIAERLKEADRRRRRRSRLERKTALRADPATTRAWQDRSRKPLARTELSRGSPLRAFNPDRYAKRRAHYRKVLSSDFHKQLRYNAYLRSGGLCECDQCVNVRRLLEKGVAAYLAADVLAATTPTPVWFTKKGGEPWRRFRSNDGEVHHDSYRFFGEENPEELRCVRWMWESHHLALEREHGTRRRFLRSGA